MNGFPAALFSNRNHLGTRWYSDRPLTTQPLVLGLSFLVLACAETEKEGEADTAEAASAPVAASANTGGYRITHRHRSDYANKGLAADILYKAELRPDPDNPGELKGTGRYEGKVVDRKVSIPECDEPPRERTVSGNIEASGSAAEMPDLAGALRLPGADKAEGVLSGGRIMSYVLATTDWPAHPGASSEDAEGSKGLGTVSRLALKLTGRVTKKTDVAPGIHGGSCLGATTITTDITVEEMPPE